jgi:hypothetical protein
VIDRVRRRPGWPACGQRNQKGSLWITRRPGDIQCFVLVVVAMSAKLPLFGLATRHDKNNSREVLSTHFIDVSTTPDTPAGQVLQDVARNADNEDVVLSKTDPASSRNPITVRENC